MWKTHRRGTLWKVPRTLALLGSALALAVPSMMALAVPAGVYADEQEEAARREMREWLRERYRENFRDRDRERDEEQPTPRTVPMLGGWSRATLPPDPNEGLRLGRPGIYYFSGSSRFSTPPPGYQAYSGPPLYYVPYYRYPNFPYGYRQPYEVPYYVPAPPPLDLSATERIIEGRAAGVVLINGRSALEVYTPHRNLSPLGRAQTVVQLLDRALRAGAQPRDISVAHVGLEHAVLVGNTILIVANPEEAELRGLSPSWLASTWASSLRQPLYGPYGY